MTMRAALVFAAVAMLTATPVLAEGWRPEVKVETDAEWLERLDNRLAPVHASLIANLDLIGIAVSDTEVDAYVTLVQEQARRGIGILDSMEPARRCALDYVAVERVLFLMFGDSVDAFRQLRAGSSQAGSEVQSLVPAAAYILTTYGDTIHADTTCAPPEVVVATPTPEESDPALPAPATTATPTR